MTPLDVIRGLLASVPECNACGAPATRSGVRAPDLFRSRRPYCDACSCPDPIEYRDAEVVRAAVRMLAEADAAPSVDCRVAIERVLRASADLVSGRTAPLSAIAAKARELAVPDPDSEDPEGDKEIEDDASAWLAVYEMAFPSASIADTEPAPANRDGLVAAARDAARWIGSGNACADFDAIADWFFAETGVMRPGKSMPAEMAGDDDAERERRFREWATAKRFAIAAALAAATGEVQP